MESFRTFQAAVALRSLALGAAAAVALALGHQTLPAIALFAGTLIGMAYLFHIATSFDRLTKGGKRYLPFLTVESILRVLLAGSAPFFIVGRGPWLGYFTYLAGFVAPLAVAIWVYKNRIVDGCAQTGATETTAV
ncbi:MAG TPA: hypothetical protein VK216_05025 [Magnetospirillaceae bacterium]|nr:hypothetical protein [Magnetospirillaceae bacterium]